MESSITRWVRDEKSAAVKSENRWTKPRVTQAKLRFGWSGQRSRNQSKLSPGNNTDSQLRQLLGVNQLDRALPLLGEEIGNNYLKLLNAIRDARKPVVSAGSHLWRIYTVPIPDSASEIEPQISNVLQGREIFCDHLENIFVHVSQIKGRDFGNDSRKESLYASRGRVRECIGW